MKGNYYRPTSWDRPAPKAPTSNQVREILDRINTKLGTHYRAEVQGAEADPGTMPPVWVLLHGADEIARGSLAQVYEHLEIIEGRKP